MVAVGAAFAMLVAHLLGAGDRVVGRPRGKVTAAVGAVGVCPLRCRTWRGRTGCCGLVLGCLASGLVGRVAAPRSPRCAIGKGAVIAAHPWVAANVVLGLWVLPVLGLTVCKPILVFSFGLDQAEQYSN